MRDRVQASDPALSRLRAGWRMLMVFPAALAAGYGMALLLDQPGFLGLVFGGMIGLLAGLTIAGPRPGKVALRCVWGTPAFVLATVCAIELQPHKALAITGIGLALCVQIALKRPSLGDFWHDSGTMVFAGLLGGVLAPMPLSQLKYVTPIFLAGGVAAAIMQTVACRMHPANNIVHAERGFLSRTRSVVRHAGRLVATGGHGGRAARKLRTAMVRLNEAAMLVDGYLPSSGRQGPLAAHLHKLVFETELAAQALGRIVVRLCRHPLPDEVRTLMLAGLAGLDHGGRRHDAATPEGTAGLLEWLARHEDDSQAPDHQQLVTRLYRFVAVLGDLHRAADAWTTETDATLEEGIAAEADERFTTPITLVRGKLPGTALLAGRTLASDGMRRPWNALSKLSSETQVLIQTAISLAIALPLGYRVDNHRFYWAAIGVLIILSNTHSPHERIRKIVNRVLGTAVGCSVGVVVSHLLKSDHPWVSLILITAALVIGAYAISTYYYIWAGALGFALIQLYGWTTGFKDSVILVRAGENGMGAAIATLVTLVVLPVATRTMMRRAQASHIRALSAFVRESGEVWGGSSGADGTREQARAVDQATHELHRFTHSLVPVVSGSGRKDAHDVRATMNRAAHYAREMSVTGGTAALTPGQHRQLKSITDALADSLDALADVVSGGTNADFEGEKAVWWRSAADIRRLQTALSVSPANTELRHALHYLGYLDDLLGGLADRLGMTVRGSDYGSAAHLLSRELFAVRAAHMAGAAQQALPTGSAGSPDGVTAAAVAAPARTAPRIASLTAGAVGSVQGRLNYLDLDRAPALARLTVLRPDRTQRVTAVDVAGDTFRIGGLEPGVYQILATSQGRHPEIVAVSVAAGGTATCDFSLTGHGD